jgi:hypothetical protein
VKARVKRGGGGGGQHLDSSEDENGEEKGFGHPSCPRSRSACVRQALVGGRRDAAAVALISDLEQGTRARGRGMSAGEV